MDPAKLAALAATRSAPPPDVAIGQLRKDKKEAVRLARLKAKAKNRSAAPLPPGKGGGGGGAAPAITTSDGAPPKVEKYRAIEDHSGEIAFTKGATLFVLGEADADGNVMAVAGGSSGSVPFSKMVLITPELLEKEREEKEALFTAAREAREKELESELSKIEEEEKAKLEALDEKTRAATVAVDDGETEEQRVAAAAKAAAQAKVAKEIEEMKAEEERLMAEAKKLEELMAALDMSDDEDDDGL